MSWSKKEIKRPNWLPYSTRSYTLLMEDKPRIANSIILPTLADEEKEFFDLILSGQVNDVQDFLYNHTDFDINCQNFLGVTALQLAVSSGNLPMVEYLVSLNRIDLADSVLHAIRQNDMPLVLILLDALKRISPNLEYAGAVLSPEFPEGMTPLMLAAQCGHYELIGMLLKRGHWLERPHRSHCNCQQCKATEEVEDRLGVASGRLNAFRTWANPSFLCHVTDDPILVAFELCRDLREWSQASPEFHLAYSDLAIECRIFAVKLLACCRNAVEVRTVLNRSAGCQSGRRLKYPRLVLAIDLTQKEFVAHPNAQNVVESAWVGSYASWRRLPGWAKIFAFLARFVGLPCLVLVCTLRPDSRRGRLWAVPINKFISSTVTYLLFLILVYIEANQDKRHQSRGPPNTGVESIIILFVLAYIWGLFRLFIIHGPKRFFSTILNVYDSLTQLLFMMTFFFWAAAWADVTANDQAQLERKFWHKHDPTLVAEGMFTLAAILAYGRLLVMLQFDYYIGPLQVALGKMAKDMLKFVTIFFFLILSFSVGLARLYQYYDGMTQLDHDTGMHTQQVESFVSFTATLKTLFWAIFCMAPLESADVIIENLPGEANDSTVVNQHSFTEGVGYICFALFEVLSVIVILNMLIATMSNTFQKVTDNVEVEWTFGRTKLHLLFFEQTALPAPFNLIPTVQGIGQVMDWVHRVVSPSERKNNERLTLADCCYSEPLEVEESDKDFSALMSVLVQRYMRYTAEGDIETLETAGVRPIPSLHFTTSNTKIKV